ncbi:UbiA family prenyltransferase [candidate division WOR-3 bacterium]|nr:UbiA family prenyltransferase [candidate division WOR-3 bacterium]
MENSNLQTLLADVSNRWMGHGGPITKGPYKPVEKLIAAFEMTRPLLSTIGPPLAGAGAVLSIGGIPSIPKILIGSFCVLIATFGIHTFNDWIDRERDKEAWPMRAIPTGRVYPKVAFILSISYFIISIVLTFFFINKTTSVILLIALTLGILYTMHFRDRVGYLSLPFIIGLFPIGGWAAFSPETLFRSPLPWILYAMAWLWQAGHIMVHSAGHPVKEVDGKRITEIKGFFFATTPNLSAILGLIFLLLTFFLSIVLFFITPLGYLYLTFSIVSGIYVLIPSIRLLQDPENKIKSLTAFNGASKYLVILSSGIIIDIFIHAVIWEYIVSSFAFLKLHFGLWLWPLLFAGIATIIGLIFVAIFILNLAVKHIMKRKDFAVKKPLMRG